eukprot:scaffold32131_cov26-Tisochrysis_lutea.AAC.1
MVRGRRRGTQEMCSLASPRVLEGVGEAPSCPRVTCKEEGQQAEREVDGVSGGEKTEEEEEDRVKRSQASLGPRSSGQQWSTSWKRGCPTL